MGMSGADGMQEYRACEALLYDWHNCHLLERQNADIAYWRAQTATVRRLLVVGAGTGRVSVPLAQGRLRGIVVALDRSEARLQRMVTHIRHFPVCADMRALPWSDGFDGALLPYSTLQTLVEPHDRLRALEELARVLRPEDSLWIDVSESFDSRPPADWHVALSAPCLPLGGVVQEWQRITRLGSYLGIDKAFRINGRGIIDVAEYWVYASVLDVSVQLNQAGFDVLAIERGYGADASPHRIIYHARARKMDR